MKRLVSLLVAVVMTFALTGCLSTANNENQADDPAEVSEVSEVSELTEVFTGKAYGMQGVIEVGITVADGMITNIEFIEISETANIAAVAIERIPAQIIEHQSLDIDTVTGATLSSRGIINAIADAAENAGLDADALSANKIDSVSKGELVMDTDVLVIGGGGAGLTAAISAAQEGADVILIEKGSILGGNTLVAGAAYNAVDPEAQKGVILTLAQKETMDGYLALTVEDEALKFDEFPEWEPVLLELQTDIAAFFEANEGKTAGVDMPGYDSIALHMWHIYTGGLRQLDDGSWIASDINLAEKLASSALDSFIWMAENGLNASYGEGARLSTVLGAMWPRTHGFMSGAQRIPQLEQVALENNVTIYTETRGTELLVDENGKVIGAKAVQTDGTSITINTTKGVVLASGGYCANPAMVKEYDMYWGEDLTPYTLSTNLGTNQGDGIIMAQAIGAAVTGMEVAQMMPSSSPTKGTMTDGIWGDAAEQIWIDGDGVRFVNEYAERDVLSKASLALDRSIFYIIYAGRGNIADPATMLQGVPYDSVARMVENGHIWWGSTLSDLAEASKTAAAGAAPAFTEEALRETIELYNTYVANQHDDDFGKEVISGAIDLEYIESNPDVGICISPRKASLHHTMGGVVIDTEARVHNTDGEIIEGLWAAGEVTGGIHAGNRLGGNAIADIFTFGRIAGLNAAK